MALVFQIALGVAIGGIVAYQVIRNWDDVSYYLERIWVWTQAIFGITVLIILFVGFIYLASRSR